MHRLEGTYSDSSGSYSCDLKIEGGEPFIVLNLEKYWSLNSCSGEHCDFVYICEKCKKKDDKSDCILYVFVVELKDIKKLPKNKDEIEKFRESIRNKFGNSLDFIENDLLDFLVKSFHQRKIKVEYRCILVVDWSVYNQVLALFKQHNKPLIIPSYKPKSGTINLNIKGCGDKIW